MSATDGVHVQHPAAAQQFHGIVEPAGDQGKIAFRGTCCVLAAHFPAGRKGAVLVQDDAGLHQRGIGQQIRQAFAFAAVVAEFQHLTPPTARHRFALAG